MEQNRFRYLSVRVIALLIAALCLAMFQTAACLVRAFRGNAPVSYTHLDVYKRQLPY